ncbi:MAG: signal peptide peptidase SppA [Deltaproteobacteria bacterium]|nr:MAG: signal peptide peptidase SppA [Deltaproteobacteria bacterium]
MAKNPRPKRDNKRATRILMGLTVLGVLVFALSVGAIAYMLVRTDRGTVSEGSFLHVGLAGPLLEAPMVGGLLLDPEDKPILVTEYAAGIKAAATDDRITGLFLTLDEPGASIAAYQEIRDALEAFDESGKPCVAYAEGLSMGSYYLASACDKVLLAPSGAMMVSGMSMSTTYYKGTLDMLDAEAEFVHVGDFKSAVEPFMRTEPSEPAAEAMEYLLSGIFDRLVADIAEGRGLSAEAVRDAIDHPSLTPRGAQSRGLIDGTAFPDAILATLEKAGDDGWVEGLAEASFSGDMAELQDDKLTPVKEYLKGWRADQASADKKVLVVHAAGQIVSGDGGGGLFGDSGMLADRPFRQWMREARDRDDVAAVVLRIDSPGGSGLASDMMWREIELTKQVGKPIVVSQAGLAASGGYYITAPADYVFAQPSTITGSIGVLGGKVNLSGTYEKVGITEHTYQRGDNATMFSGTSSFGEEGREIFQEYLSEFYDVFVNKCAEGRGMTYDEVHAVAQGRVWTGEQAVERGLVDEIGGLDDAVAKAAELAKIDDYGIDRLPRQKDFMEVLLEDLAKAEIEQPTVKVDFGLLPEQEQAVKELMLLEQILADGGVAAWLPSAPRIE